MIQNLTSLSNINLKKGFKRDEALFNGQYLRTEQIVDDIPIRLLVQSQSSVGHCKYPLITEVVGKLPVQKHEAPVYLQRLLPLLEYDDPYLVSRLLSKPGGVIIEYEQEN